jgi:hypothetical protein
MTPCAIGNCVTADGERLAKQTFNFTAIAGSVSTQQDRGKRTRHPQRELCSESELQVPLFCKVPELAAGWRYSRASGVSICNQSEMRASRHR